MKESVLDILIYLFEHYMPQNVQQSSDEQSIMTDLVQVGFDHEMIDSAFDWLENLAILCEEMEPNSENNLMESGLRHYHAEEMEHLSINTRGLLLSLEQGGVLNPRTRELVIECLLMLDVENIELHQVKWVILMVLTNCSGVDSDINTFTEKMDWTQALLIDQPHQSAH